MDRDNKIFNKINSNKNKQQGYTLKVVNIYEIIAILCETVKYLSRTTDTSLFTKYNIMNPITLTMILNNVGKLDNSIISRQISKNCFEEIRYGSCIKNQIFIKSLLNQVTNIVDN